MFINSKKKGQHLRMIGKLQEVVEEMDKILSGINDIYAAGAVEGYNQLILPQFSTYRNVAFNAYACPHGSKYLSRRDIYFKTLAHIFPKEYSSKVLGSTVRLNSDCYFSYQIRNEDALRDLYKQATKQ